jgi:hypothetical protein
MKLPAASLGLILLVAATDLTAQTTVQLPSTHYFATNSSVIVPDQGQTFIGGINSAASGQNQFGGLPGNRSRSTQGQASGMSVTAFVHDFDAYDQALLAEAARRRSKAGGSSQLAAERSPSDAGLSAAASVSDIERQRRAARPDPQREAEDYFARARGAQESGKARLARVYYQMAARRATGELKDRALAQVAAIGVAVESAGRTAPR